MANSITRLIPGSLKQRVHKSIVSYLNSRREAKSGTFKDIPLKQRHVQNAQLLASRELLLEKLPQNAVVAELGVDKGDFSSLILEKCNPKRLHLVDAWGSSRYGETKRALVARKFEQQAAKGQVLISRGLSTDVVDEFDDNYFDWIYIDTDHGYQITYDELIAYLPKMKPDGVIAGHDYIIGNWNSHIRYGVMEAVSKFCNEHNFELIYVTTELSAYPSFAIRAIRN